MPGAEGVHCFAHLDEDIREVLPYLNAELGGSSFTREPPSVTFKVHGKLITVHPRKIAINALKDEEEADKILDWLKRTVNDAWDRREEIAPSFKSAPQPVLFEVFKLLPRTNCGECNEPTCMVFAARVVEGVKDQQDCPPLKSENRENLKYYLSRFHFD
jgi:ArsR family metal-binding transcriptional regulator